MPALEPFFKLFLCAIFNKNILQHLLLKVKDSEFKGFEQSILNKIRAIVDVWKRFNSTLLLT